MNDALFRALSLLLGVHIGDADPVRAARQAIAECLGCDWSSKRVDRTIDRHLRRSERNRYVWIP